MVILDSDNFDDIELEELKLGEVCKVKILDASINTLDAEVL